MSRMEMNERYVRKQQQIVHNVPALRIVHLLSNTLQRRRGASLTRR